MKIVSKVLVSLYPDLYFRIRRFVFSGRNKEIKEILDQNKKFKNAYSGKRCFILGNGPSLKDIDLSVLADEYTFTVNQIARRKDFPSLHTNFHFWADSQFFNISPDKAEDLELLEVMKGVSTEDNNPKVFFPYDFIGFTKKFGLDKCMDCNYFVVSDTNIDSLSIDFSSLISGFHTVVQYCIALAIYMGFSEIYLYGCENTSIISNIHAALDEDTQEYGYQISENEQKRIKNAHKNVSMTLCAESFYRTLIDYERINECCKSNNIRIINCTPKSVIDSIPKMSLESVLNRKS